MRRRAALEFLAEMDSNSDGRASRAEFLSGTLHRRTGTATQDSRLPLSQSHNHLESYNERRGLLPCSELGPRNRFAAPY